MNASFLNKGEVEKVMTSHSFKLTPSFSEEQFFNNYQHELLSLMGAVEVEVFHMASLSPSLELYALIIQTTDVFNQSLLDQPHC